MRGQRTRDEAVHDDSNTGTSSNDEHRSPYAVTEQYDCISDDVHINSHRIEPFNAVSVVESGSRKKHTELEHF